MRSRWLGALLVVLVWFAVASVGGPLVGRLSEVQKNDNASFLPARAESTEVMNEVARFTETESLPFIVVMDAGGPVTPAQRQAAADYVAGLPPSACPGCAATTPWGSTSPRHRAPSSRARMGRHSSSSCRWTRPRRPSRSRRPPLCSRLLTDRRAAAGDAPEPSGLTTYVTGPGGITADLVTAFGGIDGILLVVALGVVFLILLVVYRSPVLPFAVLITAIFGLALAALVVFPPRPGRGDRPVRAVAGHPLDPRGGRGHRLRPAPRLAVQGGAARPRGHLGAMKLAWRGSVEPIAASAATVILGLLCLLLSDLGNTSGLGPVGALGIAGALIAALTFLPAVLLLFGRGIFWPAVPRVDHVHSEDKIGTRGIWGRVAALVGGHPRRTWVLTLAALLAAAAFVPTLKAEGITQSEIFLNEVESVTGQEVLAEHFPAGSGSPVQVLAPEGKAQQVVDVLSREDGVNDPYAGLAPGAPPKVVDGNVVVQATLTAAADSPEADDVVRRLRADLDGRGRGARRRHDRHERRRPRRQQPRPAGDHPRDPRGDLRRAGAAAPLAGRPLLLVAANVVSFAATMGVAALVFNRVADFPGSDPSTPLYGFVFLVALGIDYSIFLMTRVREESIARGTRRGILVGLAVTGGVITSAGVVLAATFSALAILPLLFLVQIAFIVAFGVLLDTLVVRSLLVPALAYDIGPRVWWPSRLSRETTPRPEPRRARVTA